MDFLEHLQKVNRADLMNKLRFFMAASKSTVPVKRVCTINEENLSE